MAAATSYASRFLVCPSCSVESFPFYFGREEAMAALASLGALALLLLSGLSCCSGSGLARARFWRASLPRLVERGGEEGCGRSGGLGLIPRGRWPRCVMTKATTHSCTTHVYPAARLQEEIARSFPVCSCEKESQSLSRVPGRESDTRPCSLSRSSRSHRRVGQEQSSTM